MLCLIHGNTAALQLLSLALARLDPLIVAIYLCFLLT